MHIRFQKSPLSFLTRMLNEHYSKKWYSTFNSSKVNYSNMNEDLFSVILVLFWCPHFVLLITWKINLLLLYYYYYRQGSTVPIDQSEQARQQRAGGQKPDCLWEKAFVIKPSQRGYFYRHLHIYHAVNRVEVPLNLDSNKGLLKP